LEYGNLVFVAEIVLRTIDYSLLSLLSLLPLLPVLPVLPVLSILSILSIHIIIRVGIRTGGIGEKGDLKVIADFGSNELCTGRVDKGEIGASCDRPARETRLSLIHTAWPDWEEREQERCFCPFCTRARKYFPAPIVVALCCSYDR
jgi:hypothetical protein